MRGLLGTILAVALSLAAAGAARAADLGETPVQMPVPTPVLAPVQAPAQTPAFISEIRAGLMYHEDSRLRRIFFNQDKLREDGIIDVNGEVLFARLPWHFDNWFLNFVLTPRPRIGASINTGHGTSQVSAGFAWDIYIWKKVFYEGTLDIAFHNGWTADAWPINNLRALGCSPLFRQSLSLGVEITENWRVMGTFEHLDNFGLCPTNQGLSNLGVRVGYRFK